MVSLDEILAKDKKDKEEMKHQWYVGDTTYPMVRRNQEEKPRMMEGYMIVRTKPVGSSFILSHTVSGLLGQTSIGLGDARTTIVERIVHSNNEYTEFFTDTVFHDSTNSTATWSVANHRAELTSPASVPEVIQSLTLEQNNAVRYWGKITPEIDTNNYAVKLKNKNYGSANTTSNITTSISIEFWTQTNWLPEASSSVLIGKWGATTYIGPWWFEYYGPTYSSNLLAFYIHTGAGTNKNAEGILDNDGEWHHIVGTYDGTVQKLYVDNTLAGQNTHSNTISTSTNSIQLGRGAGGPSVNGDYYSGLFDDVRVYSRAITSDEVSYSYNNKLPQSTVGLVNWFKFSEGTGVTASDVMGNSTITFNDLSDMEWVEGIHDSTALTWYLSADGGNHWEEVTEGVNHVFTNFGSDLRWKVSITNDDNYSTPYINGLKVKFG